MMINRRRVCGGKSLPYDAEIEYLESDGYAYIDTNYIPVSNTSVDVKFMPISSDIQLSRGYCPVGGRVAWENKNFIIYAPVNAKSTIYFGLGNGPNIGYFNLDNLLDKVHTATLYQDRDYAYFDSVSKKVNGSGNFTYEVPLYLFRCNGAFTDDIKGGPLKIYYATVCEGVNKVIDFIPVVKDGVGYMYDKVSGQLFGNAGTGNFIVGPRVS